MKYLDTNIPDVKIIEPNIFGDDRGFFMETYRTEEFNINCENRAFVQDNHSKSAHGVLRGLHYQLKKTQGKLVRVTYGEIYDVAVDMRKSSPYFGQHVGLVLSSKNKLQLWVPEGFAHGFLVLSESAEFIYKCTEYYAPEFEVSLLWNDPTLNIEWPMSENQSPSISPKDKAGLLFKDAPYFL